MQPERTELLVLGNGPSLSDVDFGDLSDRKTLGMNAAYRYWRRIDWRPTLYCCLDDALIDTHGTAIKELIEEGRVERFFLTARILDHHPDLSTDPRVHYLDEYVRHWHKVRGRLHGLKHRSHIAFKTADPNMLTTGAYAVRFAAMLGFTDIRLLGIDLNYQTLAQVRRIGGTRLVVDATPEQNPNYFFADYQQAGDEFNIPNPDEHGRDLHLHSFIALRDDLVSNRMKVCVSNATRKSRLYTEAILPFIEDSERRPPPTPQLLQLSVKNPKNLISLLWLWRQPAFFPCLRMPHKSSVDLKIHCKPEHRGSITKHTSQYLKRYPAVRKCFNMVSVEESQRPSMSEYERSHSIDDEMLPINCDWLNQLQRSGPSETLTIMLSESHVVMEDVVTERLHAPQSIFVKSKSLQSNLSALMAAGVKPTFRTLFSPPTRAEHVDVTDNASGHIGSLALRAFRRRLGKGQRD